MALLVNIQPAFKAFILGTKMHLGGGILFFIFRNGFAFYYELWKEAINGNNKTQM